MKNKKGFTLTEVLLAAMIVGVIGVALAALTTAALRESGAGRVRLMLRNQLSLFMRQLRQDVRESVSLTVEDNGTKLTLTKEEDKKLGPNQIIDGLVIYTCSGGKCMRNAETVLNYVQPGPSGTWETPFVVLKSDGKEGSMNSILQVRLIVGMDAQQPIKEVIGETVMLPQGFPAQKQEGE